MAVNALNIEQWMQQSASLPVLDVRSPAEYHHAHFPGSHSLPLFSDEERKIVGTLYKQQGREEAIKAGVSFFKMKQIIEGAESVLKNHQGKSVLVHCWRGGMRSGAVAWLLQLYGFDVHVLSGGYKAFRNWVLNQFEKDYALNILGGFSGSGKTTILEKLKQKGDPVIQLEALASHKGSAFGGIGMPPQPSQEMFENLLAIELYRLDASRPAWMEDESQRIGSLHIPHPLWRSIRTKPLFFIDLSFEERLESICEEYGKLDRASLADAIQRIQKRLGPLETKTALAALKEEDIKSCFRILLLYYDKQYRKGLDLRKEQSGVINKITCTSVDTSANIEKLLSCTQNC